MKIETIADQNNHRINPKYWYIYLASFGVADNIFVVSTFLKNENRSINAKYVKTSIIFIVRIGAPIISS